MPTSFLSWMRSNDKTILTELESQGANLVEATGALVEMLSSNGNFADQRKKIKDLEHQGDEIAHSLFNAVDQTFVTPIDREDISRLTSAIDEVLDYTDGTADRFVLFKIESATPFMLDLAKVLHAASQEVNLLVMRLKKLKNAKDLVDHCRNINRYEHEADSIYRTAIAELFETNNAIEIIKLKEIYENLEGALDRCADVADVVEDIALKYG